MAYRQGERYQTVLFPDSIEKYVGEEDPVRVYDVFIEELDFEKLEIKIDPNKVGNPEYDPKAMLKLLVYGTSYGWRSSRKLERATHHNVSFMWLMGGLKPDHKTISEFRRKNKTTLKEVLKQTVRLCMELDLIEGNVLFADGTKIRANAARGKNYTEEKYKEQLGKIDNDIDKLLEECERIDKEEANGKSMVKVKKELVDRKKRREKIRGIINRFEQNKEKGEKEKNINFTDPESAIMRSIQGSHASYNMQGVVDDKNGLIVNVDMVSEKNDANQFEKQISEAEKMTGKKCETGCGDAGYSNAEELAKVYEKGTKVIVPSQQQASRKEKEFGKEKFKYNKEQDCYYCPEGERLKLIGKSSQGKYNEYGIEKAEICKRCKNYGKCTTAKQGRRIVRSEFEEIRDKIKKEYEEPENQQIYKKRKEKAEHPFGHIKRNLGVTNLLLRGREGAIAEVSMAATCFNIVRMIKIFGNVRTMINRLKALPS